MFINGLILLLLFWVVGVFYASVGFGGGSSYIALLSFHYDDTQHIRILGLLCNVLVVTFGLIVSRFQFLKGLKIVSPYLISSLPFSLIGALLPISNLFFFTLLSLLLIVSGTYLLVPKKIKIHPSSLFQKMSIGSTIGLLAGMVSIGGGIFLAPFLHIKDQEDPKIIPQATRIFILINSLIGLFGKLIAQKTVTLSAFDYQLLATIIVAGIIGTLLSDLLFSKKTITILTGILLIYVSINIFVTRVLT